MWTAILALSFVSFVVPSQEGAAPRIAPADTSAPETWEQLQEDYQGAILEYVEKFAASYRAGPVDTPPASPAGPYWSRFEALAAAGEGRALVWQLLNIDAAPADGPPRAQRIAAIFARIQALPEGPWLTSSIAPLVTERQSLDRVELLAFLEQRATTDRPPEERRAALLGMSRMASDEDPEEAFTLGLCAFAEASENFVPAELSVKELDLYSERVVEALESANSKHFEEWYVSTDDGYFGKPGAPPGAEAIHRPLLEQLAKAGSPRACVWYIGRTWASDEATKQRISECLDVICAAELDEDSKAEFAWRVSSLVNQLGAERVEPKIRALIEKFAEPDRAGLLYSLGEGLCEAAGGDEALRERGLAALAEVAERWPQSEEAKRARGKLFRYTSLLIGKPVPDFETSDVDGHAFRLSDYKGKVTVIDFWGFW